MKKPLKKDYCTKNEWSELMSVSSGSNYVIFDSKRYAKDAAAYIEYLEGVILKLKGELV